MKKYSNKFYKLCSLYRLHSKADKYLIGFTFNGYVYLYNAKTLKTKWLTIKYQAKTHAKKIQMFLSVSEKKQMIKNGAIPLTTIEKFKQVNETNNGWKLEKFIYELHSLEYKGHDKIPFYQGNDLEVNGIGYQIKWENAQVAMFSTLEKLARL